jgi:transcription initiation factor IIF auxiliary subunit
VETHQMSFNGKMVKQTLVHLPHGIWPQNKKEWTINTHTTHMSLHRIILSGKSQSLKIIHTIWFHLHNTFKMKKNV